VAPRRHRLLVLNLRPPELFLIGSKCYGISSSAFYCSGMQLSANTKTADVL
jgi:hypothetical protein